MKKLKNIFISLGLLVTLSTPILVNHNNKPNRVSASNTSISKRFVFYDGLVSDQHCQGWFTNEIDIVLDYDIDTTDNLTTLNFNVTSVLFGYDTDNGDPIWYEQDIGWFNYRANSAFKPNQYYYEINLDFINLMEKVDSYYSPSSSQLSVTMYSFDRTFTYELDLLDYGLSFLDGDYLDNSFEGFENFSQYAFYYGLEMYNNYNTPYPLAYCSLSPEFSEYYNYNLLYTLGDRNFFDTLYTYIGDIETQNLELKSINDSLNSPSNFFTIMGNAFNSVGSILSIEIAPNFSLGLLISIPIAISIILLVIKLISG